MQNEIEERLKLSSYGEGSPRKGWLYNMGPTHIIDPKKRVSLSGLDLYFLQEDLTPFKSTIMYSPYFYVGCKDGTHDRVREYLTARFKEIRRIEEETRKQDLQKPNHLLNPSVKYLKLLFNNEKDLVEVRKYILPAVRENQKLAASNINLDYSKRKNTRIDEYEKISYMNDIREYDVPYYHRVAIDKGIRVGRWYTVRAKPSYEGPQISLTLQEDMLENPEVVVLAFDIETYKDPLKFPDSSKDPIMMISYMIDGDGYLITNREIIAEDIEDFEYVSKPEFASKFHIYNEANEVSLIRRFFQHINRVKPHVIVTYNGDYFDWPFVAERAASHNINIYYEIGFTKVEAGNDSYYHSKHCLHMDCFNWVQRDSYLPAGSQGLKAVTKVKLGYDPLELDPEDMVPAAFERPQELAQYSVSDAVATYYLYMEHIHSFIFSLGNLIPLNPDDVLRKGSGTLCELLLMAEAYRANILFPNKHTDELEKWDNARFLDSETYVGGHVEALEAGVFRSDIPIEFKIDHDSIQKLIENVDDVLKFGLDSEERGEDLISDIINYTQVREQIIGSLQNLQEKSLHETSLIMTPAIYHFDVGAMYPNIILTNRLQPDAIRAKTKNNLCNHKVSGISCDRPMNWTWRGEVFSLNKDEIEHCRSLLKLKTYENVKHADLSSEKQNEIIKKSSNKFSDLSPYKQAELIKNSNIKYSDLSTEKQVDLLKKRVQEYGRAIGRTVKTTILEDREVIVCQRENPFYVNTVRNFRDERYKYKRLLKDWKKKLEIAKRSDEFKIAKNRVVLFDSLQIAHKCILNSFYGYVMRKGSRWYSMEMAGVVCLIGAKIIQMAKQWVETVGRPLELDTDGIWCMLPSTFPQQITFTLTSNKSITLSYPCVVLNYLVRRDFTNHQYCDMNSKTGKYEMHNENSILFEPDGPYRAMILPASEKADKKLKKRYAVFNDAGKLVELKGFEVKRRGELKLIKIFQESIFPLYLKGTSLEQSYEAVVKVANSWLDLLENKGDGMNEAELIELICEGKNMSRTLEDYGNAKSTQITTAKRLKEFLGAEMVQEKGLACRFIIGAKPSGLDVSQRAIPIAIFSADLPVKQHFLRKWLNDPGIQSVDIPDIVDWGYYSERLKRVIQKQISIPAAMQGLQNPIPRVPPPKWLIDQEKAKNNNQRHIDEMFIKLAKDSVGRENKIALSRPDDSNNMEIADESDTINAMEIDENVAEASSRKRKNNVSQEEANEETNEETNGQNKKTPRNKTKRSRKLQNQPLITSQFGLDSSCPNDIIIFQIIPTNITGELRVFAFSRNQLYPITLTVPRILYANSRKSELADNIKAMCDQVIKVKRTLPGSRVLYHLFELFIKEKDFEKNLGILMRDNSLEGVYESKTPLTQRVINKLGFLCIANAKGQSLLNSRCNLMDINVSKSKNPSIPLDKFSYLYLIHIVTEYGVIWALFHSKRVEAQFFILNKHSNQIITDLTIEHTYEKIWKDIIEEKKVILEYKPSLTVFKRNYRDHDDVFRDISHELRQFHGPTLMIIQSKNNKPLGREKITQFPIIFMYPPKLIQKQLNPLDWQRKVVEAICHNYFEVGSWISHRIDIAKYTNIPVCNLPKDWQLYAMDVQFSRHLQNNGQLLWWSASGEPDYGGHEFDKNSYVMDIYSATEFNNPGYYKTICLEMKVHDLLFNAILKYEKISMPEMPDSLKSLKIMVKQWHFDALTQGKESLDKEMKDHFHRWLSSPEANMYDPRLSGAVKRLMTNVLWELYNKLGKVIYIDFGRIIVDTTKPKSTTQEISEHFNIIKSEISNTDRLQTLKLQPNKLWTQLLWEDSSNYGGLCMSEGKKKEIQMSWNMASYLPKDLVGPFENTIRFFIIKTSDFLMKKNFNLDNGFEDDETLDMYKDIFIETINKIKQILSAIKCQEIKGVVYKFPELPGSVYRKNNAALEFLKYTFRIFKLDPELEESAEDEKQNLMKFIEISPFSKFAKFMNPAGSLKIPISCYECGFMRDVDLCREDYSGCTCKKSYNKDIFEENLVAWVERRIMAFQLGDLRCVHCRRPIKDLQDNCDCGNAYKMEQDRNGLMEQLHILSEISKLNNMILLNEIVGRTLKFSFCR
ncbi:3204_t:CDS:10 [Ambispora gerdemannii]|uniref:DNA polymerase epsilon catalytic subunit n=1 Tax=Ambispora gerdemannii TaxID=144530 RepID=A0A9N8V0H3_9GLOM|nr:3204_t:CDS:10 [Ambispora gerdemannii]